MLELIVEAAAREEALKFPDEAIKRLYERAKEEQWSLERDVDLGQLELGQLVAPVRRAMADIYAQAQYGEMVGLSVISRSVGDLPELWAKLFGATQLMDEARHVEFFARTVGSLGEAATVRPGLVALAREVSTARSPEEIMLGTHLVFESFAQAVFQEGARLSRDAGSRGVNVPGSGAATRFLQCLEQRVGKDESRHIAFGVLYLRWRWPELSPAERTRLEEAAGRWSEMVLRVIDEISQPMARLGIGSEHLRERVKRAQRVHFHAVGMLGLATSM